ncbi:hypothetical protein, partial [Membranihabitans maritimus]|uniref:hypothetical protein n=1 Tax=Membranihabitans maritimus TaxID=2904244 RepID=UPI001F2B96F2
IPMKSVSLYQNKDITAFLPGGYNYTGIYIVDELLELNETVIFNENDFLYEYLWENQFHEIPYTGQLCRVGHLIHWIKVKEDTTYLIYDLCDLRGGNIRYFLETVRGDQFSIRMFESNAEVEVFGNSG